MDGFYVSTKVSFPICSVFTMWVNVGIGTSDPHGLILCVSSGLFLVLLYIHIAGMETFVPHGWILHVS